MFSKERAKQFIKNNHITIKIYKVAGQLGKNTPPAACSARNVTKFDEYYDKRGGRKLKFGKRNPQTRGPRKST